MTNRDTVAVALADHYELERELGHGGMATVYLAHDRKHDRRVAVKVLRPEVASAVGADRFLREIAIAARLEHPHILTLIDSGRIAGTAGEPDLLYYVMPYVDGESLRDRIAREGVLPVSEMMRLLREVVDAIAFAHRRGVVHRDIKPDNVMLFEHHAMILDFGIATAIGDAATETRLTATGVSLGTPAYMAPEQALGEREIDHRADIYAVGVLAYEMLTGHPPFSGSVRVVLSAHVAATPAPVTNARSDVPPTIAKIITRCLEKDPAARYANADELLEALDALATPPPIDVAPRRRAQMWRRATGVGGGLLVAAAAAAVILQQQRARWVHEYALPAIVTLADSGLADSAFALAQLAESRLPHDSALAQRWQIIAFRRVIHSEPEGARVYRAPFHDTTRWELLGTTPTDTLHLPRAMTRYRVERAGYVTANLYAGGLLCCQNAEHAVAGAAFPDVILLEPINSRDSDMVRVRGPYLDRIAIMGTPRLQDFRIGRHEVTNRAYKAFVDAGGYRRREYWTDPIIGDHGDTLSWEKARALLVDLTGRPGPATWEVGAPRQGEEDAPVGGISWYEARAYARFAGRSLPTVRHWQQAAAITALAQIAPGSNFSSVGVRHASAAAGMSPSGAFDMAGNVREWCLNENTQGERYILGGGFTDLVFRFSDAVAERPLNRSPINGVRVASYPADDPLLPRAEEKIANVFRDYSRERPVSDDAFRALRAAYDYDPVPLAARIDSRDTSGADWITERVSFSAAYGAERITALLFIPKRHAPPFQTVVWFPPGDARLLRSSNAINPENFGYYMRSGRALIFPIYKGTFERADRTNAATGPVAARDQFVMVGKDLRRSVEYLVSRGDIDTTRIAFSGMSGDGLGLLLSLEPRFRAGVLYVAGLAGTVTRPEIDPLNFLPRSRTPVLMLNGRYDQIFPVETSQRPFFNLLGAPPSKKKHVLYDDGHNLPRAQMITEALAWLDRWLGPVER